MSLVEALQYLTFSRPNFSYAVQQICLCVHDPKEPQLATLKRILKYVYSTLNYGLQLYSSSTSLLVAYPYVDWAGCPTTRCSTLGYYVFLDNNLLSWSSKRQYTLSRSSTEARLSTVVLPMRWLRLLVQHQRTKHIEINIHFVRDHVAAGHVYVLHVLSSYHYADIFTMSLTFVCSLRRVLVQFERIAFSCSNSEELLEVVWVRYLLKGFLFLVIHGLLVYYKMDMRGYEVPHVLVTCRSRQIDDENDYDENVPLNYSINNHLSIQFSREEFCLLTGLRFGVENREEYDTQANIPFRRRVFSSHLDGQHITGIDIENAILAPTFTELYDNDLLPCCLILATCFIRCGEKTYVPRLVVKNSK
ncbi:ribonuclease H-like domain-containing protein [Tanacetum coccineum]